MPPYMSRKPMPARTALCFGLNYPGSGNDLAGCANDAKDWAEALHMRGFVTRTVLEPTAAEMRDLLRSAVAGARSGDTVFITYSGHGTYIRDAGGDEPDGADECLCPSDCFNGNLITDDELATIFQDRHRGVRLVFVSDSCHSGTVSRFAFTGPTDAKVPKVRFLPPGNLKLPADLKPAVRGFSPRGTSPLKSSALLLSGCADWEYSFDAWFNDRANGAMTRAAIDALSGLPQGATYRDWFKALRQRLPSSQYPQSPNLFGTSDQKKWKLP